jgi:hypothetical protein
MNSVFLAGQKKRDIDLDQIAFFDLCSSTKITSGRVAGP